MERAAIWKATRELFVTVTSEELADIREAVGCRANDLIECAASVGEMPDEVRDHVNRLGELETQILEILKECQTCQS